MKNSCVTASVLIVGMLLFLLVGCGVGETSDAPPGYKEYASVVCLPKEEALQKLNLSESDLGETTSRSYYDTGQLQKICGVDFAYQVAFWPIDGVERLYCIQYQVVLDDTRQAVDTMLAIAEEISNAGAVAITPVSAEQSERFGDTTPEALEEILKTGKGNITDCWFLGDLTTEEAKAYVAYVTEHSIVKPAEPSDALSMMVHLNIAYAANADKTVITLTYEPNFDKSQYIWD